MSQRRRLERKALSASSKVLRLRLVRRSVDSCWLWWSEFVMVSLTSNTRSQPGRHYCRLKRRIVVLILKACHLVCIGVHVVSHSRLAFLLNNLHCESLRRQRLHDRSRSVAQVFSARACVCFLPSRWKCLLGAGVLADHSDAVRAGENKGGEKAEWKTFPIRSIILLRACLY